MPLLDLMRGSAAAVDKFNIEQAVAMAGDGVVRDDSDCSSELREYLSRISSDKLCEHVDHCLSSSFKHSGFILQDIVNELGRRLGYNVECGLYRGKTNAINFDGVWKEPSGPQIVVEVKTTDAYRINLDTVAEYRERLIRSSDISANSSILLVVGRKDTGDLEAQIRGSKHAWDTRVISVESLINLVKIMESADEDTTITKIRSLLTPFEYTRLDNIIDIMFTATQDVESSFELYTQDKESDASFSDATTSLQRNTPPRIMDLLRKRIISSLADRDRLSLIAHKRAQFWTPDHDVRAICTISKRYEGVSNYWYAYHPHWDEFLRASRIGYFVLGCVDKDVAYVLPHAEIAAQLENLNSTIQKRRKYWHIHLQDSEEAGMSLVLRGDGKRHSIAAFEMFLA